MPSHWTMQGVKSLIALVCGYSPLRPRWLHWIRLMLVEVSDTYILHTVCTYVYRLGEVSSD